MEAAQPSEEEPDPAHHEKVPSSLQHHPEQVEMKSVQGEPFPPVVPTWPGHYQASDAVAFTPHPVPPPHSPLQSPGQVDQSKSPPPLYQADQVGEQAAATNPLASFLFKSPKDPPPLHPPLSSGRARGPTPRLKHSETLLNIRKPLRVLKIPLRQNVKRYFKSKYYLL